VRGGLNELFGNKQELALAVVHMVEETWYEEVGYRLAEKSDPVETLIAVARATAAFIRHQPPVLRTLKAEFDGIDHPVARAVNETVGRMTDDVMLVVVAGRRTGAIPPGPPPQTLALAYLGAIRGVVNHLEEPSPFEALLAEKTALGVLGLAPMPASVGRTTSDVTD
jgi:AcrR family transcriptional regulator